MNMYTNAEVAELFGVTVSQVRNAKTKGLDFTNTGDGVADVERMAPWFEKTDAMATPIADAIPSDLPEDVYLADGSGVKRSSLGLDRWGNKKTWYRDGLLCRRRIVGGTGEA